MFEKIIITLVLILSAILVFSGCAKLDRLEDQIENRVDRIEDAIESKVDPIEDAIESKADAVEDAVENALLGNPTHAAPAGDAVTTTNAPAQEPTVPAEPMPVTNPAQESIDKVADILGDILKEQASTMQSSPAVPQDGLITPEEAKRIALDHAGVSASDAIFDRTERDFDNGIYHYEIEFRVGFTEYEYDIHAETGKILSFDQDR